MSVRKEIIAGLITALKAVKSDETYPIKVKKIKEYDENYLNFDSKDVPVILVNDIGSESLLVRNGNSYKYGMDFFILGFVHANSIPELRQNTNDVQSFIKQFISETSGTDIHVNAQALEYEGSESAYHQSDSDADQMMGLVSISVSMRWFVSGGNF